MSEVTKGEGWSVSSLDDLGEGYGFRKIRTPLGVTAFGVNAIVLPPGYTSRSHAHETQEEIYFVHSGRIALEFGDGTVHELDPGGVAWVDAPVPRRLRNLSDEEEAVYLSVGGKDGYVERDGVLADF